ncbi:hypothetical protein Tco_0813067 [Tanacetum coccineum]
MGMSSPGRIRIARHRRILSGETTGANGNSDDRAIIADGAGKMGAVGISGVEVVGDTCLLGISVSDSESSEHRKGETIGEATTSAPTFGATRISTEIELIRITRGKEDPTLLTDTFEEIEITGAAIACTSKSLYKSPLYQTMQGACNAEESKNGVK